MKVRGRVGGFFRRLWGREFVGYSFILVVFLFGLGNVKVRVILFFVGVDVVGLLWVIILKYCVLGFFVN